MFLHVLCYPSDGFYFFYFTDTTSVHMYPMKTINANGPLLKWMWMSQDHLLMNDAKTGLLYFDQHQPVTR